jgi:isoquinoline 1-oxidoreductase beta subunit
MNAFIKVSSDNTVTVVIKHQDMGQGVTTGLTTIVAEELDADWAQMRWEYAPADASRYANSNYGIQATGGSSSIHNSWPQLRQVGAAARAMLVEAAAKEWGVPAAEIQVKKGVVSHDNGSAATFGDLAVKAASITPPAEPSLKDPKDFELIGAKLPRIDSPEKVSGNAIYTIDVTRPGMLTAMIAHPPKFGGRVASFDATAANEIPGVQEVVEIPTGVAVLADNFWAASRGRDALSIEWDFAASETRNSAELMESLKILARNQGAVARNDGDVDAAFAEAETIVERTYEFPFLAHATMEPMNAVVELSDDLCEIWTASQAQSLDQRVAAGIAGVDPANVKINTLSAGGSFGRRAPLNSDYVAEAVMIAKAIGGRAPVKLQWSREDDIKTGLYRPMSFHRLRGGLDADGNIIAWSHRIVAPSFYANTPFSAVMIVDGVDKGIVDGAKGLPYAIPNLQVDMHIAEIGVPTLLWRSVGHTHNGYATETFLDALAIAGGKDPIELRRELLKDHPRHLGVLNAAVELAGDVPSGDRRHRGVAVHESFRSFVAEIADVSINDDGTYKVDRVACAVDCGVAVNPDVIKAQMEGGIGMGLGSTMREQVLLENGEVLQNNFYDYFPLRISDMPEIDVAIIPSAEAPTGVGEPGLPPAGPALANAIQAATGKTPTILPIGDQVDV